jgi:hypothetical protein
VTQPPPEPTNTVAAASGIGKALITALPPAFLVLAAVNVAVLWLVFTAVENQADQRLSILNKVIERCLGQQGFPAP